MTTVAPYGTWSSSLTPAAMATQGRRYGFVSFDIHGARQCAYFNAAITGDSGDGGVARRRQVNQQADAIYFL